MEHFNTLLLIIFLLGQALSIGNMIWQQINGYREINPIYGEYPSIKRIYMIKVIELILIFTLYAVLLTFNIILAFMLLFAVNLVCWGFIAYDRLIGIPFKMEWR